MAKQNNHAEFADVHKRQLFHWIGGDIDADQKARRLNAQQAREKYLLYLKDDLENGLPVKCPRIPEELVRRGAEVSLDLPMACFTEWALSESRPHSSRYGRMAFGFSKPWIMKHGGQPVSYFNYTQAGLFLKNMLGMHEFLSELQALDPCPKGLRTRDINTALDQARYLLHFAKPFAPSKPKAKPRRAPKRAVRKPSAAKRPPARLPARRYYGPVLEFLEEREWRIVRHKRAYFVPDPAGRFDSRLKFKPGSELFTLLLPDNELVKMVWRDRTLRKRLLDAPVPVSVLSFQDIGTF